MSEESLSKQTGEASEKLRVLVFLYFFEGMLLRECNKEEPFHKTVAKIKKRFPREYREDYETALKEFKDSLSRRFLTETCPKCRKEYKPSKDLKFCSSCGIKL